MPKDIRSHEGVKYLRIIYPAGLVIVHKEPVETIGLEIDVYSVLETFKVTCPAVAHAVKKLLCLGQRGKGDKLADLMGVEAAVSRAIELEKLREQLRPKELVGEWKVTCQMEVPITPSVPTAKEGKGREGKESDTKVGKTEEEKLGELINDISGALAEKYEGMISRQEAEAFAEMFKQIRGIWPTEAELKEFIIIKKTQPAPESVK